MRPERKKKWRPTKGMVVACLLLPVVGFVLLVVFLDHWGWQERAQPADAIIVLGAQVRPDGSASQSLRGRVLQAAELYNRGLGQHIICTGGIGDYAPSEAEVAASILEKAGARYICNRNPRRRDCFLLYNAVLREQQSHSTWENAVNSAEICRGYGWKRVIIVSDPYHLWRARRDFQRQGLTVYTSPSHAAWLTDYPARRWQLAAREACAVLRDLIIGPR